MKDERSNVITCSFISEGEMRGFNMVVPSLLYRERPTQECREGEVGK